MRPRIWSRAQLPWTSCASRDRCEARPGVRASPGRLAMAMEQTTHISLKFLMKMILEKDQYQDQYLEYMMEKVLTFMNMRVCHTIILSKTFPNFLIPMIVSIP